MLGHSDVRSKKMHDFERAMLYSRTGSLHDAEHASSAPIRHLYTDGSLQGNVAGCGVYDPDTNLSWSWQLTGNVSSQRAELDAAIRVCQTLTGDLSICTDSQYVVRVLEELIPQYRGEGSWGNAKNVDMLQSIERCSRNRKIRGFLLKGHSGVEGNEKAHKAAHVGASFNVQEQAEETNGANIACRSVNKGAA